MIAQSIQPVNTPTAPAPRQFRPEGSGLGINPARQSGRMVRATWDTHLSRIASIPTENIEAYQAELHQERRTGYARFIAGQSARSCANNLQWGGWLWAQKEYKAGRFASYSPSPQCQESMSQAERQGYQSGLAHQRRMEVGRE